jgi:glycosyltransferase involved in cell wall biosynthesis
MILSDVLCLSHLRWNFVFQRPNHLMSRAARDFRVFFIEEPLDTPGSPHLEIRQPCATLPALSVVVPRIPACDAGERVHWQRVLLDRLMAEQNVRRPLLWTYTPMALQFSAHVDAGVVVYDCMDELKQFVGAPPQLAELEAELFARADVVFTGGESLYQAKRRHHPNVHAFPSSVDSAHFAAGRVAGEDPPDQAGIAHPRVGFFGVIDERLDVDLLARLAALRPDLSFVMIGPVVKIDPASLPRPSNIHWLGAKHYDELPRYIKGWDVTMMPFARNAATEFISPTKTLEFMAAGKPVVSTAIQDVVRPYGEARLVRIAHDAPSFARAIDEALAEDTGERLAAFDACLAGKSWDGTWDAMANAIARIASRSTGIAATDARIQSVHAAGDL